MSGKVLKVEKSGDSARVLLGLVEFLVPRASIIVLPLDSNYDRMWLIHVSRALAGVCCSNRG